jgi:lactate permease
MPFPQNYDPLHSTLFSTLAALLPVVVLLAALGLVRMKAHSAALLSLVATALVAVLIFGMPSGMAGLATLYGVAYGFLPIGWIIVNVIFLYNLANQKGLFAILQDSLTAITRDRRLQLLLVAFCFGAFFEGAAGFGTPVAVTSSILIGLGFSPMSAAGLSLIANTAPVPYAGLGTPLVALQGVTGLDLHALTTAVAQQLAIFDVLIPFWILIAFVGWKAAWEVWPAALLAGGSFAIVQYLVASLHGPWLVNIVSSLVSLGLLVLFLLRWKPRHIWRFANEPEAVEGAKPDRSRKEILQAWLPWLILSVVVFIWGLPQVKTWLDSFSLVHLPVMGLDQLVRRMPPVVSAPQNQSAIFDLSWLSASGTGILLAALIAGLWMGHTPRQLLATYALTWKQTWRSLITISAMMAIGFVTRYAGMDGTLGLAFARTGPLYPFFGTLLGWMGVVLTGSDTSSNVLFGSLQRITAEQLGLNPLTMAAANSSGGVMGKMINAQSIVVASTATHQYGKEGEILRYVFFHSLALAALAGLVVMVLARS